MTQKQQSRGRAARLAQDLFGYEQLRPGQEAALSDVLDGNDTLAVMPTDSGKSMHDPRLVIQGFDRPNIWLSVEKFQDEDEKKTALLEQVIENEKPGIVYTATHKHAEEVAEALLNRGVKASFLSK